MAIATALNVDSRVYTAGVPNGNDGLSLLSIADAALANLSDVAVRITELATQSANGVYSNKQREALDKEAQALVDEYLRITKTTEFNGVKLFNGSLGEGAQIQTGYSRVTASIGGAIGTWTFWPRVAVSTGTGPYSATSADLNGDGKLDLFTADFESNTASIFLGNGNGTFQNRTTVMTGSGPLSVTTGDLNGDGVLDLVTANSDSNTISIFSAQTTQGRGGLLDFSLSTKSNSLQALGMLSNTLDSINAQRGTIGTSQARIAVALSNLQIGRENFSAAESRIQDTDVASDTAILISSRIIQQSGAATLSQANQQPALALKLLGL